MPEDEKNSSPSPTGARGKIEFIDTKNIPPETQRLILQFRAELRATFDREDTPIFSDALDDEIFRAYVEVAMITSSQVSSSPEETRKAEEVRANLPKGVKTVDRQGRTAKFSFD